MYKFKIRNEANNQDTHCDLYINSCIENDSEGLGISAKSLIAELEDKPVTEITLHINSEGGDLFESLAIYNWLCDKSSSGIKLNAIIEGLCASGASVVAMACENIAMNENSYIMIHNPIGYASGDSEELAGYSEMLADISNKIINIYASRTGLSIETIKDLMNKESWMNAETCKTLGFCNEIIKNQQDNKPGAKIENKRSMRIQDSAEMKIDNNFKPVDKAEFAIKNMAGIINRKRGH